MQSLFTLPLTPLRLADTEDFTPFTSFTTSTTLAAPIKAKSLGPTLVVSGTDAGDVAVIGRTAAGALLVNGGSVPIVGTPAHVSSTTAIKASGGNGHDTLVIDESRGGMPSAQLYGGAGNDSLVGGSRPDLLFGQSGNDTLWGGRGNDQLFGGSEDDLLTGGIGDDMVFGEAGNDRLRWTAGDGTDLFEGGEGSDTAEVAGSLFADVFTATANGSRVRIDHLDAGLTPIAALDLGSIEQLGLAMGPGDDRFAATGNLAALIAVLVDGGAGNDTISGSNGADTLAGGDDADVIEGRQGNDQIALGAGDDRAGWNPGDGTDSVDGGAGHDTLAFAGSAAMEAIALATESGGVRLTRNVGNVSLRLDGVEIAAIHAGSGEDVIGVGDLAGSGMVRVEVSLAATLGSGTGDGVADRVQASGSAAGDEVLVTAPAAGSVAVGGLAAAVVVSAIDATLDGLVVRGEGGADRLDAAALPAGAIRLTLEGGAGHDTLIGSGGADALRGGDDDDRFFWAAGGGNDSIDGEAGNDTLELSASGSADAIDLVAMPGVPGQAGHAVLFVQPGGATIDVAGTERVVMRMSGGADRVSLGELADSGVAEVHVDLAANTLTGDGEADTVSAVAGQLGDTITVSSQDTTIVVQGLSALLALSGADGADTLALNGLGGDDLIDAAALGASPLTLLMNGGLGADTLIGSAGTDHATGGDGNDQAQLGAGDDRFSWSPGDDNDTVDGGEGIDTLAFNGATAAEVFDIAALAGGGARLARNIASVTTTLHHVETIELHAAGGADVVFVGQLAGSGVQTVHIDLAPLGGSGGDGQSDSIVIQGSAGDDVVVVVTDGGRVHVMGLAATLTIDGFEPGLDRLQFVLFGGDDALDASALPAGYLLSADGGIGNDVLIGGASNDTLFGGEGDDVLIGNGGNDLIDGGPGEDIEILGVLFATSTMQVVGNLG